MTHENMNNDIFGDFISGNSSSGSDFEQKNDKKLIVYFQSFY